MKKILLFLLLIGWVNVFGSHIVGGEFELLHISGTTYRLNMILYFDVINGNPGAFDNNVNVEFYRKRDNFHMMTVLLSGPTRSRVSYTQPSCSNGELITDRIFYTTDITLGPDQYNDPDGYYISWQRCCRNYTIDNIFSENPSFGTAAGQTFYMEFPPVVKNGQPFYDSTPHLFPPLNDYACPYRPYYVNFAGTDDDNDSIVYSLVTPLNTTSPIALPAPSPGPYPNVTWRPGFDLEHITGGAPDMSITPDGFLTVTPKNQGLYVFAVKVEEYRDKVKIGETRRDFQMLVLDQCAHDDPPVITGKKLNDGSFSYLNNMSIDFSDTVSNGSRCIQVKVTDPQSLDPADNFSENITIKAIALGFKSDSISKILPAQVSATLTNGSERIFTICFPQCPYKNGPYQVGIVAFDDACSLPMTDTLRITVNVQPPPNTFAYFLPPKSTSIQLNEGQKATWPFTAKDDDGDKILLSVVPDKFELNKAGMIYHSNLQPGLATGSIDWNAFCKFYDFAKQTDFTVRVLADDLDKCKIVHYDTALVNFKVVLPASKPVLTIYNEDKSKDLTNTSFQTNLGHITLDLVGEDHLAFSTDSLTLSLLGASGTIQPLNYSFPGARGFNNSVESVFKWDTDCSIFKEGVYDNHYTFQFVFANNHCLTPKTDTAFVKIEIKDVDSSDQNFLPPNVITANGDNCNDYFAIDGFDGTPDCNGTGRVIPFSAPLDNCVNRFEQVRIYNRWGKQVFESTDRKFRWYALSESPGVYYYFIKYTRAEYKSSLTVIH
jgi:hypothetical protein